MRLLSDSDLISGIVRAGVAGTQLAGERLTGLITHKRASARIRSHP